MGISLVEMLISLAICTALLTATTAAFVASSASVQVNADFARACHTARVTLSQMESELRRADAASCDGTGLYFDVIRPAGSREPNEISRRFAFDAAGKKITLQVTYASGKGTLYTLASYVQSAKFGAAQFGTDGDGQLALQRLPISLTVQAGKQTLSIYGSAAPRRSLAN